MRNFQQYTLCVYKLSNDGCVVSGHVLFHHFKAVIHAVMNYHHNTNQGIVRIRNTDKIIEKIMEKIIRLATKIMQLKL